MISREIRLVLSIAAICLLAAAAAVRSFADNSGAHIDSLWILVALIVALVANAEFSANPKVDVPSVDTPRFAYAEVLGQLSVCVLLLIYGSWLNTTLPVGIREEVSRIIIWNNR
ncbi:MAG TPA: hypothetical protein VK722_18260 [Candidatus Aquilonibacter sp.]|nr:hypothetical protein [Candidatus Aquilonibacter sp.]